MVYRFFRNAPLVLRWVSPGSYPVHMYVAACDEATSIISYSIHPIPFILPPMVALRKTHLYYVAAVCLLLVSVVVGFLDLPGNSLWYDEAVVSFNSRGSLGEVIENTRDKNSSPILYPLVLYAVQKR